MVWLLMWCQWQICHNLVFFILAALVLFSSFKYTHTTIIIFRIATTFDKTKKEICQEHGFIFDGIAEIDNDSDDIMVVKYLRKLVEVKRDLSAQKHPPQMWASCFLSHKVVQKFLTLTCKKLYQGENSSNKESFLKFLSIH